MPPKANVQSENGRAVRKKKADQLTLKEVAELDATSELDRIFTPMNAMLATQYANWR